MAKLTEITKWLDNYLDTDSIPDYPNAYNGLQAENNGQVTKVAAAVDASLNSIRHAADSGVDLLIVHHGLYWQGVERLTGSWREKCQLLLDHNIALYSSHIPLDIHPEIGNNTLLAQALGLQDLTPCVPWKGIQLGIKGNLNTNIEDLNAKITSITGTPPFISANGETQIKELYIITGGAGSELMNIYDLGGRNFLSGEGNHWNIPYAEEKKMNFFLAGHYLTETFGVDALSKIVAGSFDLKQATLPPAKKHL